MGHARSRAHPANRGAGARAQISRRGRAAGQILPTETMSIRRIFLAFSFAGTLASQTFLHLSDPQFGMYSKNANFQHETVNFEFAIATANRLKPAFVVITGDLINDSGNAAQTAEFKRIAAKLDPAIKLYNVAGN